MKLKAVKHIALLFVSLLTVYTGQAQKPQQLFNTANALYSRQAYDSALACYDSLLQQGYHSAALYFNAGNASYQAGRAGYAVYYFTKALQLDPGNAAYTHNLRMAQLQASNKIHQIPTLFFVRWWHVLLHFFSVNTWLVLSIGTFWLLLFFVGWRRLSEAPPRFTRPAWIVSAALFLLTTTGAFFSWQAMHIHNLAIVVNVKNPLRQAPDENSGSVEYLNNGAKVRILDSVDNWKKIRLDNGTEGWYEVSDMKIL